MDRFLNLLGFISCIHLVKCLERGRKPWKGTESITFKGTNQMFYCKVQKHIFRAWGFWLQWRVTLDVRHHPAGSHDALQCFTKLLPEPLRRKETRKFPIEKRFSAIFMSSFHVEMTSRWGKVQTLMFSSYSTDSGWFCKTWRNPETKYKVILLNVDMMAVWHDGIEILLCNNDWPSGSSGSCLMRTSQHGSLRRRAQQTSVLRKDNKFACNCSAFFSPLGLRD